jgi:hypothetical protein
MPRTPTTILLLLGPLPVLAQDTTPVAVWPVGLVIGALVLFVAGMAWLVTALARRLLVEARTGGAAAFARLTELPCGVPDGTIRALISCFIIIFGFLLIGLQKPLGLASAEALTGFIGAVISFYFATRHGEQARQAAIRADTPPPPSEPANTAAGSNALANARGVLDAAAIATGLAARLAPGSDLARRAEAATAGARQALDSTVAALHSGDAAAIAGAVGAAHAAVQGALGRDNPATEVIADALAGFRSGSAGAALLGLGGPAGLVAAVGIGAFQAVSRGTEHFERWKARVLDRPYTTNLFPPGPVDAAVALSALELSPIFAAAFLPPGLPPAERFATAARLAVAVRQDDAAALAGMGSFASWDEFEAGLQQFRGRLLDHALDAVDAAPIDLAPVGLGNVPPVSQQALRDALQALRQDPQIRDLDSLVLLLTGLATSPDLRRAEALTLLRHQLAAAGPIADAALRTTALAQSEPVA